MSDKLQEIKASVQAKRRLQELKSNLYGTVEVLMMSEIEWLIDQLEKAQQEIAEINSHGPEGRNYTNEQYVSLLQENQKLVKAHREIIENVFYSDTPARDASKISAKAIKTYAVEVHHGTSKD